MVKDGITVMTDVSVEISRELGKLIQFTTLLGGLTSFQ
jgi:hypothetical protein